jgi:SAM-dependent methyltransferase
VSALRQTIGRLLGGPGTPLPPVPPEELIRRSGWTPGSDVAARYRSDGLAMKETLVGLLDLPRRARVLDFGCGVGKVSQHFAGERERFELFGADIDAASIDWLAEHHSFYGTFVKVEETPGLPWPDGYFDLVFAVSVFTHISDLWAACLLELRRVLAPGGLFVATVLGEAIIEVERGGTWNEDEIGMNVLRRGQDWAGGGPTVFLSHWWIREHWGRAFEIVEIREDRNADGSLVRGAHDLVIARPRQGELTVAELERIDPDEPRELRALQRNIAQLHADDIWLRDLLAQAQARGDAEHEMRVEFSRQLEAARAELEGLREANQ